MLAPEQIDANARTFQEQAHHVLDPDPDRVEVRRNGEWLDMAAEELFRLARTTTVAQLLERDDFAQRYAASEPISVLELLYPLLQGYDSVAIRSDVELGGTDQMFNLLLGRDVQRAYGQREQVAMTLPILPGHRRRGAHVEVHGELHRGDRSARGDLRQDAEPSRRRHGHLVRAAAPPPGARRRRAA